MYEMYDPSHRLKSVRNNLTNYVIDIQGKQIKWGHIKRFYYMEKARGNTGLWANYKLTDKHIELAAFSSMSVPLAAQTLSRSVAAGISKAVGTKELPPQASYTADFCERMDQLFNNFNSGKSPSKK